MVVTSRTKADSCSVYTVYLHVKKDIRQSSQQLLDIGDFHRPLLQIGYSSFFYGLKLNLDGNRQQKIGMD